MRSVLRRPRRWLVGAFAVALLAASTSVALAPSASAIGDSPPQCFLTAKNSPSALGSEATFRFFVSTGTDLPPGPIGLVSFFSDLDPVPFALEVLTPDGLTEDHSSVEASTSDLSQGTHTIRAILAALPPQPPLLTQCNGLIGVTATQVVTAPASTTTVTSSTNPSVYGQATTFGATVTRSAGGTPAGSVQFQADGNDLGAAQILDTGGRASLPTSSLPAGNHAITAVFTSTGGESGSVGTLPGGQTIHAAATSTSVTTSPNPSTEGDAVTLSATVTSVAPGAGTPGGTVQFSVDGVDLDSPRALNGSGAAATTTTALAPGNHTISASYTPADPDYAPSSGTTSQFVKAATILTYTGVTTSDYHDAATVSAQLTRQDDGTPLSGRSVHFTMAGQTCLATTTSTGVASCSITPQEAAGDYSVDAAFAGDTEDGASTASKPFTVTREETTLAYTGLTVILDGGTLHASGDLAEDGTSPIAGRSVTFTLGTGATAQSCTATTDAAGSAGCDIASVNAPLGPGTITASFPQDPYYMTASDTKATIVYAFPTRGAFAIGDGTAAMGTSIVYSDAQWWKKNVLSGGSAPAAFKGFVTEPGAPPACGGTFTTSPGGSGHPPASVPSYMGTIVTSKVTKSGANLTGTRTRIVVVATASAKPGRGTVVAEVCPG